MAEITDPFRPPDRAARDLAQRIMTNDHGVLAVLLEGDWPYASRIGVAHLPDGGLISLLSTLAPHTGALKRHASCSVLLADPVAKGDPLNQPRLSLQCTAAFLSRGTDEEDQVRRKFLALRPKAKLYADFTDFSFVRFTVNWGTLNAGFGKAFRLEAEDLKNST